MSLPATLQRRLDWAKLPVGVLILLLQRTPAVRVMATAVEFALSSPLGHVLKSSLATAAALGGVNTLAGATELSASQPSPAQLAAGVNATIAFSITGTISEPETWTVGGTTPPGLTYN